VDVSPACTDPDGDALTVEIVTQGSIGTASVTGSSLHYLPGADESGSDTFTYRAQDGANASAAATVSVSIAAVNDDPDPEDDAASANEDEPAVVDVLANDVDGDGDPLLISEAEDPLHGSVTIAPDGRSLVYGPDSDTNGTDVFEYTVTDGLGGVETAEVTVTIAAVNDPPRAVDDTSSVAQGGSVVVDVLANDAPGPADESSQTLAVASVGLAANGVAAPVIGGPDAGKVRYAPNAGSDGADSFTYVLSDGAATATGTVRITVTTAVETTICGREATILGTPGDDVIQGTPGDDVIRAKRGNDVIDGGGGNDVVCGGPGTDQVTTGAGDDLVAGGSGRDTVDAGAGRNRVRGGAGGDSITTGSGIDSIAAGTGDDAIVAGSGQNTVAAGAGDDTVESGSGNDRIDGGPGTDTCDADGGTNTVLRCE
jgi:Ca2+-binding RTX toxin-like protein